MPLFEPPVAMDLPSVAHPSEPTQTRLNFKLFRHFGVRGPRGRTVLKINGTYATYDYPPQSLIDTATEVYLGGHKYQVSDSVAAALTAAGYGSRIT